MMFINISKVCSSRSTEGEPVINVVDREWLAQQAGEYWLGCFIKVMYKAMPTNHYSLFPIVPIPIFAKIFTMRKQILALIVLTALLFGCGPTIYKAQDFDTRTASHKTVAILPAEVSINLRPNEMKKITPEQLRESEQKTSSLIQDKMYTWFLRRSDRFKYTVSFQDIGKTNALLLQAGIKPSDMIAKTKDEIAKLLGVDAVITTRASMQKPMSDGGAVALGLLFGVWGNTNEVQTSIAINEAEKGDLVWKYDYRASGSVGSNTDNLVNALMRNCSRRFPYNAR
jgi:hypothetical protein